MTRPVYMNGADYVMSVFDHHLRSIGGAGNLSHLLVELSSAPDETILQARLAEASRSLPMLSARQKRGCFSRLPYWQLPAPDVRRTPALRSVDLTTSGADRLEAAREQIFNDPLCTGDGELVRFTLIRQPASAELVMTWTHPLMDARGAEAFLRWIGRTTGAEGMDAPQPAPDTFTRRAFAGHGLRSDLRQAWQYLRWLDRIGKPPPLSLYTARAARVTPRQRARFLSFSEAETTRIRNHITNLGGFLGETKYLLAATLYELNRLCRRAGIPAESFLVNLPSNARDKSSHEPVFSNLSSFVTYYLRTQQAADFETALTTIQNQTRESLGLKIGEAFDAFGTLVRRIPMKSYWDRMKLSLNNEIGSLFFANTGNALPGLTRFLGQDIVQLHHATSVTAPPGVGVFFHTYRSRLCVTFSLLTGVLEAPEEQAFVDSLRARLLEPLSSGEGPL